MLSRKNSWMHSLGIAQPIGYLYSADLQKVLYKLVLVTDCLDFLIGFTTLQILKFFKNQQSSVSL